MSENTTEEVIQKNEVTPVPQTPAPAKAETTPSVAAPVESPTEKQDKKVTAAFIAQRQKIRELEAKAKAATLATPPPATPANAVEAPAVAIPPQQAPTPVTVEYGIDATLEKQALDELAADKDLAKVSMGVVEVLEMIDNDPSLHKLYLSHPKLAIREAKSEYMSKMGITNATPMPVSTPPSGGMGGGGVDLEAMYSQIERLKPGTLEWHKLANKIDAELKRHKA